VSQEKETDRGVDEWTLSAVRSHPADRPQTDVFLRAISVGEVNALTEIRDLMKKD
jgi:3-deoxy-D-manno-octulosonic-acid transferase